jgi:hypothetical protein
MTEIEKPFRGWVKQWHWRVGPTGRDLHLAGNLQTADTFGKARQIAIVTSRIVRVTPARGDSSWLDVETANSRYAVFNQGD